MKKLRKGAMCTDIHFGKKANSRTHNQDCLDFIEWFCKRAQEENCDYVAFLGDWNENRSSINIDTLGYSFRGAKALNDLGVPVFFVVGNHDLYHRHNREIHSIVPFEEFSNFHVINEPTVVKQIEGGALFCPYLFHDEYPRIIKHLKLPFWAGHFEFRGFSITNYGIPMPTGPNPADFIGPEHIVSGHFHKRQANGNIIYMGNTFPMDFGDAGDIDRGMMVFNHDSGLMEFFNWEECPKYIKTSLSSLLEGDEKLLEHARVRCLIDIPVNFEESNYLRQKYSDQYNLREFAMEEAREIHEALSETEEVIDWESHDISSIDDLVHEMLTSIKSDHIDNGMLVRLYSNLKVAQ